MMSRANSSRSSKSNDDVDVVIVGAGIAGMTAAYTLFLKDPSLTVIVLEASNELGGRGLKCTPNENSASNICDLERHFFSSRAKELYNLLKALGVDFDKIGPLPPRHKVLVEYKGVVVKTGHKDVFQLALQPTDALALTDFLSTIEKLCDEKNIDPQITNMNMREFLEKTTKNKTVRDIMQFVILSHCGLEAADISVGFYLFLCISTNGISNQLSGFGEGMREYCINDSLTDICQAMASHLDPQDIYLNQEVTKIKTDFQFILVQTKKFTIYRAQEVIFAIPPTRVRKIKFTPPLPLEKQSALSRIATGKLGKFAATYDNKFWNQQGLSGGICVLGGQSSSRPIVYCHDGFCRMPVLCGTYLHDNSDRNMKETILRQLSEYVGKLALKPVSFVMNSWDCGSPMCVFASEEDFQRYRDSMGRVIWTGAESAIEWYGSLGGAVSAGKIAALEALYDLRPGLLTNQDLHVIIEHADPRRRLLGFRHYFKTMRNWKKHLPWILLLLFATYKIWRRKDWFVEKLKLS